jgi:D-amino-acid dehydrogenase
MDVIVIGAGAAGMATAYQLRTRGHRVCVVEQHASVAHQASFGHGGLMLPTPLDVLAGPQMMRASRAARSGMLIRAGLSAQVRRFQQQIKATRDPLWFAARMRALHPLVQVARAALTDIETHHELDFEQRVGVLHVFADAREFKHAASALELLVEHEVPHEVLSGEQCARIEPSVPADHIAQGVWLPYERSANCPLYVKQLKQRLDGDVQFEFGRVAIGVRLEAKRASVQLRPREADAARRGELDTMAADAIVIAAGAGSAALLARAGLDVPLQPARVHALTAPIAFDERAPHVSVVDSARRITITRLGNRLRIAGAPLVQSQRRSTAAPRADLTEQAIALLGQAAHDWIPGAARISAALPWDSLKVLSPDGLPLAGASAHPRLFVACAHGPSSWALSHGSAKVVADLVSGAAPELPAASLAALSPMRFNGQG